MRTLRYVSICSAVLALLLPSCVKDKLYDPTDRTEKGLVVTADWTDRSETCAVPAEYTLRHLCCGQGSYTMDATAPCSLPVWPEAGLHCFAAYNTADGIMVDGLTATVATDGRQGIVPLPGYLLTALHEVTVTGDATTYITLPMKQRMRDLHIEFIVVQGDPQRIRSAMCTLSGVAAQFDMAAEKTSGDASSVRFALTRDGDRLTGVLRLLGFMGGSQALDIRLDFTDGESQYVTSDLTEVLADFGSKMTVPYRLEGKLHLPTQAGVDATISGWAEGEGDSGAAEQPDETIQAK